MVATTDHTTLADIQDRATVDTKIACELFGLDHDSILKALRNGDIPGFKIGHVWRIPVPALMRMLGGDTGPVSDVA